MICLIVRDWPARFSACPYAYTVLDGKLKSMMCEMRSHACTGALG